jgi:hypothetical protein
LTVCGAEGAAQGWVRQGPIGFVECAHPQPGPTDPWGAEALDQLPAEAVLGPVPFGMPVFSVAGGGVPRLATRLPSDLAGAVIEDIAAFLPCPTTG